MPLGGDVNGDTAGLEPRCELPQVLVDPRRLVMGVREDRHVCFRAAVEPERGDYPDRGGLLTGPEREVREAIVGHVILANTTTVIVRSSLRGMWPLTIRYEAKI